MIGINAQIQSTTGTAEGVGFAIPIDIARRSLDQLAATGESGTRTSGSSTQDVTPGIADEFGLDADARGARHPRRGRDACRHAPACAAGRAPRRSTAST